MQTPSHNPNPPTDEHGRLLADVPCHQCGYNLRGQRADGRCSECDCPIERSIALFRNLHERRWIRRLRNGVQAVIISLAIILAIGAFSVIAVLGEIADRLHWPAEPAAAYALTVIIVLIGLAPLVTALLGCWAYTTPPSGSPATFGPGFDIARKLARTAAVTFACTVAAHFGLLALIIASDPTGQVGLLLLILINAAAILLSAIVGCFAAAFYSRDLARRLRRPGLAWQAMLVGFVDGCIGIAVLVLMGLSGALVWMEIPPPAPTRDILFVLLFYTVIASAIFGPWTLALMIRFAHMLNQATRRANRFANSMPDPDDEPAPAPPQPAH